MAGQQTPPPGDPLQHRNQETAPARALREVWGRAGRTPAHAHGAASPAPAGAARRFAGQGSHGAARHSAGTGPTALATLTLPAVTPERPCKTCTALRGTGALLGRVKSAWEGRAAPRSAGPLAQPRAERHARLSTPGLAGNRPGHSEAHTATAHPTYRTLCLQTEGPVPSPTGGASAETPVLLLKPAGTLPQRQHGLPGHSLHSAVAETDTNGRNHSLVTRPLRWQHQNTTVLMSQELLSSSPARAGKRHPQRPRGSSRRAAGLTHRLSPRLLRTVQT